MSSHSIDMKSNNWLKFSNLLFIVSNGRAEIVNGQTDDACMEVPFLVETRSKDQDEKRAMRWLRVEKEKRRDKTRLKEEQGQKDRGQVCANLMNSKTPRRLV